MNKKLLIIFLLIVLVTSILVIIKRNENNNIMEMGDGNMVISCVGDSITYGYGLKDRKDSWVFLLPKLLGEDYKTINYGLVGATLLSSGDIPYFNSNIALEFNKKDTDKIIFMLGSNDSKNINWNKNKFSEEYNQIVDKFIDKVGRDNLYIMTPPKIFLKSSSEEDANNDNLKEAYDIIIDIGNNKNVNVIDLYKYSENHKDWYSDGLHLNKKGNKEVAKIISKYLK